jgi:hypothetical protein
LPPDKPAFSRHQIELLVAAGIPKAEAERLYTQRASSIVADSSAAIPLLEGIDPEVAEKAGVPSP